MKAALAVAILAGSALDALAQSPIAYGVPLSESRFGALVREAYTGTLGWTSGSGTSHYSATATLRGGQVHCVTTARSEEGTFETSGPGLIEISLGLDPDADDSTGGAPGTMYIVRAACPHPRSSTPREARWSDEYNTYKQPASGYNVVRVPSGIIVRGLPGQLKGRWDVTTEEESRSMIWNLCLLGMACPGQP